MVEKLIPRFGTLLSLTSLLALSSCGGGGGGGGTDKIRARFRTLIENLFQDPEVKQHLN